MPIRITETAGGVAYANPFVGNPGPTTVVKLDVSGMTTNEVDVDGYLKPGTPLLSTGVLVSGAGQTVFGVVIAPVQIAETNTGLAGDTSDPLVTVATSGLINRDIAEDNLGRALSANELAALALGQFVVTTT
jgi:hypothetical protein